MATNITRKGQVTVPKRIRDYLGLKTGSPVEFDRLGNGEIVLRPVRKTAAKPPSRFEGLRGAATVRMTTSQIMKLTRPA